MKLLYLTALVTAPNEAGEEKIDKSKNRKREDNVIDWESLGLRPPKDEIETDEDGVPILSEEDMEEVGVAVTIPINNIGSYVTQLEGGSLIYLKDGIAYNVIEDVWEIDAVIELYSMSWIRKGWLLFKSFFRRKNKQIESINNN